MQVTSCISYQIFFLPIRNYEESYRRCLEEIGEMNERQENEVTILIFHLILPCLVRLFIQIKTRLHNIY